VSDVGSSVFVFVIFLFGKAQENPDEENLNILLESGDLPRECKAQVKWFLSWAQGQSRTKRAIIMRGSPV
jgi:hypothetical protein